MQTTLVHRSCRKGLPDVNTQDVTSYIWYNGSEDCTRFSTEKELSKRKERV